MEGKLIAKSTITVNAPASKVWAVLTTPETIQKVMLGMQPRSDWKVGSELRWIGRHEEKPNDNARGIIQVMDVDKKLQFTVEQGDFSVFKEGETFRDHSQQLAATY